MNNKKNYIDKNILLLRRLYKEEQLKKQISKQEISIGNKMVPICIYHLFEAESDFEALFYMKLPDFFKDMDVMNVYAKYPSMDRPEVIKTNATNDVCFTFSRVYEKPNPIKDIEGRIKEIQSVIQNSNKNYVFYDSDIVVADEKTVPWFDFRGYCMDGNYYGLCFGFYLDEYLILGNFHCKFSVYDIWKPAVLKLLSTIECP